jgi:hypothetical protein
MGRHLNTFTTLKLGILHLMMLNLDLKSLIIERNVVQLIPIIQNINHLIYRWSLSRIRCQQQSDEVSHLHINSLKVFIWNVIMCINDC